VNITGDATYDLVLTIAFAVVACTTIAAFFIATPYGRFADAKYGLSLDPRLGWFLMELPATLTFFTFYPRGPNALEPFPLFVAFVWAVHYLNRGFLMPLFMRVPKGQKSGFGLMVVVIGWGVTGMHGYLNATWASRLFPTPGAEWFTDPRFILGVILYYGGLFANLHADHVLRNLRTKEEVANGERKYRIPTGGLFAYVTNASYLSELVLWAGFAIFTWSPAGVFILAISAANLVPRALATHRWYLERFPDYPKARRILIPFVY
jgi:3-oxo-5-alpha-steroid 4-dehydrogenase 1